MYVGLASASYSNTFKQTAWYYPVGIMAAIIANLIWLWISKLDSNPSSLAIKGLYWDSMLTITYMAVPLLFFGAKLNNYQISGLLLIFLGLVLTKL